MVSCPTTMRPGHPASSPKNRVGVFSVVSCSCTRVSWSYAGESPRETVSTAANDVSGIGRWLSKDPIGISGGVNQYQAFASNPVNARDPYGLWNLWSPGTWGVANGVGYSWYDSLNPFHESSGLWGDDGGLMGASMGAAAALDGIIPFWDPLEIAYTDECGVTQAGTEYSRALGQYSRDLYIATLGLRGARFRGLERGRWKVDGVWQPKQLHFHLDWGSGLGAHHLPQQTGNFLRNLGAVVSRWWGAP